MGDTPTDAENVIITPPELYEQAKSLKIFHDEEAIPTDVVNTTWIYSNYANASDPPYEGYKNSSLPGWNNITGYNYSLAKKIIKYLSDTANHSNLKYVTLFGNARLVPPGYYSYVPSDTYNSWIPTDFFFASPDYDLVPNYMVGRLPVNNTVEAEHVVQKIKHWDGNVSWDWFNNVALAGGRPLWSYNYTGEMIAIDSVNRNSFNGMNITKLFKTDGNFTKANVTHALSGNTGMIYVITHGDGQCIEESYYFELCVNDLLSLSPDPKVPVVVSIACMNGAFDTNVLNGGFETSFGEAVLLSDAAGIAYIGGARRNHGEPYFYLDDGYLTITKEPYMAGMLTYVFEAYHNGSNMLGNITRTAIWKYVAENDFSHKYDNVTLFGFVLLGDPALELPPQRPGDSYQQPDSTAINPKGYVDNIPWYNTNTSITINSTTDSPTVYTKRIEKRIGTYAAPYTVEKLESNTSGGAFDYTFSSSSSIEADYLVRTSSEDGKEGWLYLRSFFPVHNLNTSENFSIIQAAIYDADTEEQGHIIEVDPGTYKENVKVNKSLTIRSTSGNPADTIVSASDSNEHIFEITADCVNISGFTLKNATATGKAGIYLKNANHCNISDTNISNNSFGIILNVSSSNTFENNNASNNTDYDFYSDENSHGNTVKNLTLSVNYPTAISFSYDQGIGIKSVETPPLSAPSGKTNISKYVNAANVTESSWIFLNVSYTDADLGSVTESTLKMYKYNTSWLEVPSPNGVTAAENYVYANISSFFSIFAPFGDGTAPPIVTNPNPFPVLILSDTGRARKNGTNISQLNVTVMDDTGVDTVTINLSPVGGSATAEMTHITGTDIWTGTTNATADKHGTHNLVVNATNKAGYSNTSVNITLSVRIRGDVYPTAAGDGTINIQDSFYMQKYIVGKVPQPDVFLADVYPATGDGSIDLQDTFYMSKYIVGKVPAP